MEAISSSAVEAEAISSSAGGEAGLGFSWGSRQHG